MFTKWYNIIKGGVFMPIIYKIDILTALKEKGFSTYRIRKEKLFPEGTVQAFRRKELISLETIARLCELLNCQPNDIIEYVPEQKEAEE